MNNFLPQKRGMQVVWIIVGCLIYAVGLNVFIIPMNLYSGGAVGLAQLLSYGAGQIGIKEIAGLNLYGIIYLLLNIPILFIAWFKIGKTFFINTILGTVGISLFTSIVPTPATAVIADPVIGIIIGGVVTGAGIGIMLTAKGSGGGIEVIGIWMAKKYAGMSVGKLGTIFNLILYAIYLLVFDISTVIYSVVYLFFYTVTLDRMHFQNINVRMLIFTKKKGIAEAIMKETGRGVTQWNGEGAFTSEHNYVLVTIVNKFEVEELKEEKEENVIYYENGMSVMEVADALGVSVTDLVKKLFVSMGIMASATQALDRDTTELIAIEYGYELKNKKITDMTRFDEVEVEDKEEDLVSRPAIVTIMGHVDHGKTTLLDTIRSSHVVSGEAGGITQHIGAYQVVKNGKTITFIDTPGHAAFTEMRARGAQITDIVILVVAADDGVMPQTKEAIEHAQAAGVPIIVAINKMDKAGANPDRIKTELTEYNLVPEDWGGDTIYVPISALTGKGVDELLEMVILVSELKDYKANPNRLGMGTVIEAKLDKGRGPVATLLVQNGTIKVGDVIVVGTTYGKIRSMEDETGKTIQAAGPSKPVSVTGLVEVPFAGEKFMALNDERKAREIAEVRTQNKFNEEKGVGKAASLNDLFKDDENEKTLNLIIKCDVQGSIEAIRGLLEKINIEGTSINIISARVGGITNNDIILALASHAIIIGFNVRPTAQITDMAKDEGVEIRLYNIIYKLQEDIEKAVKGLLDPVFEEKITGQAEVREIFKVSKVGTIAGSYVTSGSIVRSGGVRLIRDSIVIYTGRMAGLRRFKDDVKEVKAGYECGITIENYNDIKVGDVIECFVMEEAERE